MKKLISIAIAAACLLGSAVSCNKVPILIERYGFDTEEFKELQYIPGHEDDAESFINDLNAVTRRFDGTEFTENEIVAAYDEVINKHNNKYIQGTFSLYKFDIETGEKTSKVKTWTMTVAQ